MAFDTNKPAETAFNLTMKAPSHPRALCGCRVLTEEEREEHENSEHGRIHAMMTDPVRSHLRYVAGLLRVPKWMGTSWCSDEADPECGHTRSIKGGWREYPSHEFLSFAELRSLIAARAQELNVDMALVEAHSHSCSEPGRDFFRLDFATQMNHFRKVKS